MPLTALRELTLPSQKALTSRDQKTFLWRFHYSIGVRLPLRDFCLASTAATNSCGAACARRSFPRASAEPAAVFLAM
eukprot:5050341-Prymnesium_polylepis.1